MALRLRLTTLIPVVAILSAVPAAYSVVKTTPAASISSSQLVAGKRLYRQYCGQCHALSSSLAAGFGSGNGLGQNGGEDFNTLKVSSNLCIVAVTGQFGGHALVQKHLNWTQLTEVANFVASATKNNSILARETDG